MRLSNGIQASLTLRSFFHKISFRRIFFLTWQSIRIHQQKSSDFLWMEMKNSSKLFTSPGFKNWKFLFIFLWSKQSCLATNMVQVEEVSKALVWFIFPESGFFSFFLTWPWSHIESMIWNIYRFKDDWKSVVNWRDYIRLKQWKREGNGISWS